MQEYAVGAAVYLCNPPRENRIAERPQTLRYPEIKNKFPLNMARAQAEAIENR